MSIVLRNIAITASREEIADLLERQENERVRLEREIARLKKRVDILEAAHRQIVAISHDARAVDISESALPNGKDQP